MIVADVNIGLRQAIEKLGQTLKPMRQPLTKIIEENSLIDLNDIEMGFLMDFRSPEQIREIRAENALLRYLLDTLEAGGF